MSVTSKKGRRAGLVLSLMVLTLMVPTAGVAAATSGSAPQIVRVDSRSVLDNQEEILQEWRNRLGPDSALTDGLDVALEHLQAGDDPLLIDISVREAQKIAGTVPLLVGMDVELRVVGLTAGQAIVMDYYSSNGEIQAITVNLVPTLGSLAALAEPIRLARVDLQRANGILTANYEDWAGRSEMFSEPLRMACEDCDAIELGTAVATGGACLAMSFLGPLGLGGSILCFAASTIATTGAGRACTMQQCRGGWPEVVVTCGTSTFVCNVTATVYSSYFLSSTQTSTTIDLFWIKEDGSCPDCFPADFAWDQRSVTLDYAGETAGIYRYQRSVQFQAGSLIRPYVRSCATQVRASNHSHFGSTTMQNIKMTEGTC
jgi:hypothetical protein